MDRRSQFEKQFLAKSSSANLKTAIAAKTFILVMTALVIEQDKNASGAFTAIFVAAFETAVIIIFDEALRKAAITIGLLNTLLTALFAGYWAGFEGTAPSPQVAIWIVCTTSVALVCIFVARGLRSENQQANDRKIE